MSGRPGAGVPRETEAGFTRAVLDCAALHGWLSLHVRPGLTRAGNWVTAYSGSGKGFPDLVLLRDKRLVVAELKVGGRTTPEQELWLAAWRLVPAAEVFVWRPPQWGEIERVLGEEG